MIKLYVVHLSAYEQVKNIPDTLQINIKHTYNLLEAVCGRKGAWGGVTKILLPICGGEWSGEGLLASLTR